MATGTDVYCVARELIGTPWRHQGRRIGVGVDCIGVPIYVTQRLSLGEFNFIDYPRIPDGTMQQRIADVCDDIILNPGALLVFRISKTAQHCGIVSEYMDGLGLIHAWNISNRVVEHRLTRDWLNKVVGCYGLPGVHYV